MHMLPLSAAGGMNDMEYAMARRRHNVKISVQLRSAICKIVMWLALLLIGILAIPALLFIFMIGLLWELADTTIRTIDP